MYNKPNDKFGVGFRLDERQLHMKLQTLMGAYVQLIKSGIFEVANNEQKEILGSMAMIYKTYHEQMSNEVLEKQNEHNVA